MIIEVDKLTFEYNRGTKILKNITFKVDKGQIVGILGSNGSGKTTLINLLIGYLKTSGHISVLDQKPDINNRDFKSIIGVVRDDDEVIEFLTLYEYLYFVGNAYNIERQVLEERIDKLLDIFQIKEHKNRILKNFSHGMIKKAQIISAILHQPKLLIVDEPTNGLDIEMIALLKNIFKNLKSEGTTLLISTHNIDFVRSICDRVIIINSGEVSKVVDIKDKTNIDIEDIFLKSIGGNTNG